MPQLNKRLFQLLVLLAPTQLVLHFWPDWSLVLGVRVDYLAPTIFLTDLVILVFIFFNWNSLRKIFLKHIRPVTFLLVFILFNVYFAEFREIAIVKWIKIIEFSLLVFCVSRMKNFNFKEWFLKPFIYSLAFFSTLGIFQVILGKTIDGPFYFLGERTFNTSTPGIALVQLFDNTLLRAYSTFPHPNALAGFLSVALLIIVNNWKWINKRVKWLTLLLGLGLLATFSKTAIAVLITLLVFSSKLKKEYMKIVLILSVLISVISPLIFDSVVFSQDLSENISQRIDLSVSAGKLFSETSVVGLGANNFIPKSLENLSNSEWIFQPVHNIFLLTLVELGIIGVLLFFFLFSKAFSASKLTYAFLFILMTGLMDHYWFTLQQNMLLLSLSFGIAFNSRTQTDSQAL